MGVAQPPSAFMRDASKPSSQVTPDDLKNVGIDQRLDQELPLDLQFKDEAGKTVKLGDYFQSGQPGDPEPGVLHLPHAVRRGVGGTVECTGSAEVHSGQRIRSSDGQL